ncbi:uncharacterized protein LOC113545468 [Pangasianodon hypophthalmus]|uniref:uncharacterized protein LOC113545468 n=1 Tax=Pangasianodon hypophthalmus TaxID=310915 RepID=UPI0023079278|nr:uncharacterized protein LOC113545468 [Pangasianodon hypophthalmus]XP_053091787.1 uncharacterized protein LOC113545468 [Pangasianodon hypophthalmus]XP_053091841.1 uncharacterized protein LOC113545468 [Pangasianodon hypophthalmus]
MTSQEKSSLHFVSWNTNGIKNTSKSPKKFSKLLNNLSNLQADIAFIQETHVGPKCYKILEDVQNWNVYFTVHSSRSKGVAILIRYEVPFEYICHDEDCSGSYIVLFCRLYDELYTLVNVYNHKADRNVLARLKDYLRETAEGVLVVGGDFNMVLDPSFDRLSSTLLTQKSSQRAILEDFTTSLNLRDTWSYLHFADGGFTRRQNESHSRLDMFFMCKDAMGRVCSSKIQSNEISDHKPLVLELRVQQQTGNKIPKVALQLEETRGDGEPDRRPGKISGAEILSAIKSLTDSEQRPDTLDVDYYKIYCCQLTETLKRKYNLMIKNKQVPEAYNSGSIFNVDYLIFSEILAKRLSVLIAPSLKREKKAKFDILLAMTLETDTQEIRWSFLEQTLRRLQQIPFAPPWDFSILGCLLPKVQNFSGERRRLQPGCPLTNTILNLALTQLEDLILRSETECRTSVSFHRQALLIHADESKWGKVVRVLEKFQDDSGIRLTECHIID